MRSNKERELDGADGEVVQRVEGRAISLRWSGMTAEPPPSPHSEKVKPHLHHYGNEKL